MAASERADRRSSCQLRPESGTLIVLRQAGGIAAVDRQLTLPPSMHLRKDLGSEMAGLWKIPWVRRQRLRFRRPLQILASPVFARYITFVIKTLTVVADPPDFVDRARNLHPSIIALWHGQFFLLPGITRQKSPGAPWLRDTTTLKPLPAFFASSALASFAAPERLAAAAIAEAPRPPMGQLLRFGRVSAMP